jgi:nicotinamidase-related amidase
MDERKAVLVLDLQRDFLEPTGRLPVARHQVDELIRTTNAVVEDAGQRGIPVIYVLNDFPRRDFVANVFRRWAALSGSRGAELDPRVRLQGQLRVPKHAADAFTNPELDRQLQKLGVKQVVILGVFANACVRATAQGALRKGYQVTVVRDGVAAGSDRSRDRALERLSRDGAIIATSAALCAPRA